MVDSYIQQDVSQSKGASSAWREPSNSASVERDAAELRHLGFKLK